MRWFAALALVAAACSPSAMELVIAGRWSAGACAACFADRTECDPAIACSGAVQVMASEGARHAQVRAAGEACVPRPRDALTAWSLGPWADAAGELAGALAEQLREREKVRIEVLKQVTADLDAERLRLEHLPQRLPSSAGTRCIRRRAASGVLSDPGISP